MKIVDLQPLAKRRTHFTFHKVSPIPFFLSAYDTKYWHFEQSATPHGLHALFLFYVAFFSLLPNQASDMNFLRSLLAFLRNIFHNHGVYDIFINGYS
jgi:hypothetical protein